MEKARITGLSRVAMLIVFGSTTVLPMALFANIASASNPSNGTVLCSSSGYTCVDPAYAAWLANPSGWAWKYYGPWGSTNSYGYHNCTTYAAFRLMENGLPYPGWYDNAGPVTGQGLGWAADASAHGVVVNQTPAVGAIAQWQGDSGHVAYVDQVLSNGSIITTDDNYGVNVTTEQERSPGNGWPDNFIHFDDQAPTPGGATDSFKNGSYVSYDGNVYVIAGGAPLYVSNWAAVGGAQPTTSLTQSQWEAFPEYPANGTFVSASGSGEVFVIAGGAPLYVSNWSAVGGAQPTTLIDQADIANAGQGSPWNHLNVYPANGTFVSASGSGEVFVIAGGAPLYVSNWSAVGGAQSTTLIDQADIANAGQGSPWNHLNVYPANGTFVRNPTTEAIYEVAGGFALYVDSCQLLDGCPSDVTIDPADLTNAGGPSPWNHLLSEPASSTVLESIPSSTYWLDSNGCWEKTTASSSAVTIDDVMATELKPCQLSFPPSSGSPAPTGSTGQSKIPNYVPHINSVRGFKGGLIINVQSPASAFTGFVITYRYSIDGGIIWKSESHAGALRIVVRNLTEARTFSVVVQAKSLNGTSDQSNRVNARTL
jgi:surface antigen